MLPSNDVLIRQTASKSNLTASVNAAFKAYNHTVDNHTRIVEECESIKQAVMAKRPERPGPGPIEPGAREQHGQTRTHSPRLNEEIHRLAKEVGDAVGWLASGIGRERSASDLVAWWEPDITEFMALLSSTIDGDAGQTEARRTMERLMAASRVR
ncbi:hypothetical protein V8E36_000649 [Tilletia maclaganii]